MPSPFPGMNPYFEQPGIWRGMHGLLLGQITFALNARITPRYHADYEESLYIGNPTNESADRPHIVGESREPVSATIPKDRKLKHR